MNCTYPFTHPLMIKMELDNLINKKKKQIHLPMQEAQAMRVWSLGHEGPLEKETATRSSILSWRIPRTEEPGGLQSTGRKEQTRRSD